MMDPARRVLVVEVLRHAADWRTSIRKAADVLDPSGEVIPITVVVTAIDARAAVECSSPCGLPAGGYHKLCREAAVWVEDGRWP